MANLKLDLLNKLNNDKYFAELELVRLAQDPAMSYMRKISDMARELEKIAIINAQLGGVEQYFKEPEAAPQGQAPAPAPAPAPMQVHQGQTHGE